MIYFDNAATTAPLPEVIQEVEYALKNYYGNPSSVHAIGREAKVKLEESRRKIAALLQIPPNSISFTSGATEAISIALNGVLKHHKIKTVLSSPLEHSAVLKTLNSLHDKGRIELSLLEVDENGGTNLTDIESYLDNNPHSMLALMHANNVFGRLNPIAEIGKICKRHNAIFFCDTVQSMGKYALTELHDYVDIAVCSAHKLHGPKGVGFLYARKGIKIDPSVLGGDQEKAIRSGTENVHSILGMAKAFEVAYRDMDANQAYILSLKKYLVDSFHTKVKGVQYVGNCNEEGLYNLLNFVLPIRLDSAAIQFILDNEGIAISTGSACSSGAVKASPAVEAIQPDISSKAIRVSLSKFNTKEEVDVFIKKVKTII